MTYGQDWTTRLWWVMDGGRKVAYFTSPHDAYAYLLKEEARKDQQLLIVSKFTWGFKFNTNALWIGLHYSEYNKRLCVNYLPCCTLWFVWPGGKRP